MRFSLKRTLLLACMLPLVLGAAGCETTDEHIAALKVKAEKGDADAMVEIAETYYGAKMIQQSDAEGAKWMKMAAERGNAKAQYTIGIAFSRGLGVPLDIVEAHKWEYLAACNGYSPAKESIRDFESKMSSKELQQAKNLEKELPNCSG